MIRHHPDDPLLMGLAAGTLSAGHAAVVGVHIERCARCLGRVSEFEAVGGALLDSLEPRALAPDVFQTTLDRIAATPAPPVADDRAEEGWHASPPAGATWPRALRGSDIGRWRRLSRHMRFSRIRMPHDPNANVYLLRVAASRALPSHGHRGGELTQVLHGAFDDGDVHFGPGDFEQTDGSILHRPMVSAAGECVCLISVEGRVAFENPFVRIVGSLLKM